MDARVEEAAEVDFIDRYVQKTEEFSKRYARQLVKWLPAVVGFSIFLAYFFGNHFYPSFDLFQFSSLLISAAVIGFVFVGLLAAGIASPGLITVHFFVNKKTLRGSLRHVGATDEEIERNALWLVFLCFVIPYALSSLATSALIVTIRSSMPSAHALVTALISLCFGVLLQVRFKLPKWSFLRYAYTAFIALLVVKAVVLQSISISQSDSAFGGMLSGQFQTLGIFLVPLFLSVIIGFFTMAAFGGFTHSLCISVPLALAIAFYSGALTSMPERVVKGLGLGNYEAASLIMEPEFCEKNLPDFMPSTAPCVLKNPTIIWSLGDTLTLRVGKDTTARQVQIPSRFVKAIVRNPG
ncbi:hypothetical protein [Pseudomonas citronellolis]|uniref:hypothetical protein n=1 Tax=Pseudomonas citronellolis TaxID=53408 RepID=UPI00248D978A|nr:hypothetical protein [Pseudomonas citronellolis]